MLNLIALAFLLIPSRTIAYEAPPIVYKTIQEQIIETFGSEEPFKSIAFCESGIAQFNAEGRVLRGQAHPADTGLFQINMAVWGDKAKELNLDPETLEGNIQMAKYIYDTQGLSAWEPSRKCWKSVI